MIANPTSLNFIKKTVVLLFFVILSAINPTSAQTHVFFDENSKKYGLINNKTIVFEADNLFIQNIGSGYFAYTKTGKVTNEIVEGVFSGYRFKNVINAKYGIVDSLGRVQCLPVFTFVDAVGADGLFLAAYDTTKQVVIANLKGKQVSPKNYFIKTRPEFYNEPFWYNDKYLIYRYNGYSNAIPDQLIAENKNLDSLKSKKFVLLNSKGKKIKTPAFYNGFIDINGGATLYHTNQTWDYYIQGKKQNKMPITKMIYKKLDDEYSRTFYYLTTDKRLFRVNWKSRGDTANTITAFQLLDENVSDLENVYYGDSDYGAAIFLPFYTKKINEKIKPVYNDKQNKLLPEYDSIKGKRIEYVDDVNYTGINYRKEGPQLFALKKGNKILYVTENNEVEAILDNWDKEHFYDFKTKAQLAAEREKQVKDSLNEILVNSEIATDKTANVPSIKSLRKSKVLSLLGIYEVAEQESYIVKGEYDMISRGDSLYIWDTSFNVITLPKFQDFVEGHDGKVFSAQNKKGKWGIIDVKGKPVCEFKYTFIGQFVKGFAPYYSGVLKSWRVGDKGGYINDKGQIVVPAQFTEVKPVNSHGLARVYVGGKWGDPSEGGQWKVLDVKSSKFIHNSDNYSESFILDESSDLSDSNIILMTPKDSLDPKYGYLINGQGKILLDENGKPIEKVKLGSFLSSSRLNNFFKNHYTLESSEFFYDDNGNSFEKKSIFSLKKGKFILENFVYTPEPFFDTIRTVFFARTSDSLNFVIDLISHEIKQLLMENNTSFNMKIEEYHRINNAICFLRIIDNQWYIYNAKNNQLTKLNYSFCTIGSKLVESNGKYLVRSSAGKYGYIDYTNTNIIEFNYLQFLPIDYDLKGWSLFALSDGSNVSIIEHLKKDSIIYKLNFDSISKRNGFFRIETENYNNHLGCFVWKNKQKYLLHFERSDDKFVGEPSLFSLSGEDCVPNLPIKSLKVFNDKTHLAVATLGNDKYKIFNRYNKTSNTEFTKYELLDYESIKDAPYFIDVRKELENLYNEFNPHINFNYSFNMFIEGLKYVYAEENEKKYIVINVSKDKDLYSRDSNNTDAFSFTKLLQFEIKN